MENDERIIYYELYYLVVDEMIFFWQNQKLGAIYCGFG